MTIGILLNTRLLYFVKYWIYLLAKIEKLENWWQILLSHTHSWVIIRVILIIFIIWQIQALLDTLELQASAGSKGHFALYNCLVLGHNKYKGVQRVYCNPFPKKPFYGSNRLDPVMIRPPGIEPGGFVASPDSVWYARVLLLFSASAATDTGSNSFECALVSTMETYDDPENGDYYLH